MTMLENVKVVDRGHGIAEIALSRPEALNALSTAMAEEIAEAVRRVRLLHPAVVVLTSSSPRAFSVGADLKERRGMDAEALLSRRPQFLGAYRALLSLDQPVVAGIDGFCIGGGFELALTCDLLVCSSASSFALTEVAIGLVPGGGGTQLLGRRAGWNVAMDLILTGRRVDGIEAARLGIVDRCVTEDGRAAALEVAMQVAKNSPSALALAKAAIVRGRDLDLAGGLDAEDRAWRTAAVSDDRIEGITAFLEKRSPRWPSAQPSLNPNDPTL